MPRSLTIALLLCACSPRPSGPNVVLLTLDTTRADYLSCYGYPQPTTPVLDALAAEGTRFDLAISTAAVTPVSHAAILTGRFNRDHGVRVILAGSGFRMKADVPTLATVLGGRGYRTLAIHSSFPVSPNFGLGEGYDVMETFDRQPGVKNIAERVRRSDQTIDIALRELRGTDEPFFLWVHLWDPHDWAHTPPEGFMPTKEELEGLDRRGRTLAIYAAEVRYMDSQIGRLFEALEQAGSWDDTIVAVTADHGQGLWDHDWEMHRLLYQEQIRVPLILRLPGVEQVPVVSDLVRTVDIAPTIFDYASVDPPAGMGGRSLRPLIEGREDDRRITFAEQINGYDYSAGMVTKRPVDDFTYCAMDGDWKLVWRPNHPDRSELFHVSKDPRELTNEWRWDHPEAVRLKRELGAHAPWVTEPFEEVGGDVGGAFEAALESLGYVGGGEKSEGPEWEWVCPEHNEVRSETLTRCEECSSAMILIAVGK